MEDKHVVQLQSIREEKDQLQVLVSKQNSVIEELERQLVTATVNNSALQRQQQDLMATVHSLLTTLSAASCECAARAARGSGLVALRQGAPRSRVPVLLQEQALVLVGCLRRKLYRSQDRAE